MTKSFRKAIMTRSKPRIKYNKKRRPEDWIILEKTKKQKERQNSMERIKKISQSFESKRCYR